MSDAIRKNQVLTRNTIEQNEHEPGPIHAKRVILIDDNGDQSGTIANPLKTETTLFVNPSTGVDTPEIANVPALLANTEYSYTFPDGTTKLSIKNRQGSVIIKYAWNPGESGTRYITIGYGVKESIDGVSLNSKTIYFQVSKDDQVVEIQSWS